MESRILVHTSQGNYACYYSSGNGLNNMVWSNIKMIVNTKNHRYVRLYHGKDVYDIDLPPQTFSDGGDEPPRLRLSFFAYVGGVAERSLWIDKVILTDDETI